MLWEACPPYMPPMDHYCGCTEEGYGEICEKQQCLDNHMMAYWFVMFVDFNGDLKIDHSECDKMNCEWATPMCHEMINMCDYN